METSVYLETLAIVPVHLEPLATVPEAGRHPKEPPTLHLHVACQTIANRARCNKVDGRNPASSNRCGCKVSFLKLQQEASEATSVTVKSLDKARAATTGRPVLRVPVGRVVANMP